MATIEDLFQQREATTPRDRRSAAREQHKAKLIDRMLVMYGPGPAGATCQGCRHLERKRMGKVYLKCAFGPHSDGPATDWRARWPACGKFEATR